MKRLLGTLMLCFLSAVACSGEKRSPSDRVHDEISGVTENTGHFVINPQFDEASSFADGLAAVRIGDWETGKWGFIDKQGKMVINPQFVYAGQFTDGLALVRIGGKIGFISR